MSNYDIVFSHLHLGILQAGFYLVLRTQDTYSPPHPLHCPWTVTSTDAHRSIPIFWLCWDNFPHRDLQAETEHCPGPAAPHTQHWVSAALCSFAFQLQPSLRREFKPQAWHVCSAGSSDPVCKHCSEGWAVLLLSKPWFPARSLLPTHTSGMGRTAAFAPLHPSPTSFVGYKVSPVTGQHRQLNIPIVEHWNPPWGHPANPQGCQELEPQLLLPFAAVWGHVAAALSLHSPPRTVPAVNSN